MSERPRIIRPSRYVDMFAHYGYAHFSKEDIKTIWLYLWGDFDPFTYEYE